MKLGQPPLTSWDYNNRIASSTYNSRNTIYSYDHTVQRVKVATTTGYTVYPSTFYNITKTNQGTTTNQTTTVSAHNIILATVASTTTSGPTLTYHHTDHLGSLALSTNTSGTVTQTLDYYPYGSERINSGTQTTNKHYIGEVYDEGVGLNYLNARYYDGARGQFLSQDPVFWEVGQSQEGKNALLNPQLQNSYSYAGNNPVTQKDPTGRYLESGFDVAMFAVSLNEFMNDQSWSNAGALALDVASLALPGVPAVGGMALRAGKAVDGAYSVYQGLDAAGTVKYVGITGRDPAVRIGEHLKDIGTGREALKYSVMDGTGNLTRDGARLIEQSVINTNGLQKNGGTLLNKINSISPASQLYKLVPNVSGGSSGGSSLGGVLNSLSSALKSLSNALSKLKK